MGKIDVKIENSKQFKIDFFLQYIYQNFRYGSYVNENAKNKITYKLYMSQLQRIEDGEIDFDLILQLKQLGDVTSQEKIHLAKIYQYNVRGNSDTAPESELIRAGNEIVQKIMKDWWNSYSSPLRMMECFQFLIKNGYALPFRGKSVHCLVKMGWIELITKVQ